ncbi:MAG: DUF4252 domain-containing protein [Candidatus Cryptobacteroides sp.]
MKRIIMTIVLAVTTLAAMAQSGESLYRKYSDSKGVNAVYVSPAMFRMIGSIPDMELNDMDVNLTPIIKKLNGLYMLETETADISKALKADVERFVASKRFELMMEVKSDGNKVRIYTAGDTKTVESLVMLVEEEPEMVFISLDGTMDRKELEEILASARETD